MSVRNGFVLLLALSALLFLAACGGSGNSIAHPVAPPSGNFSNSNLNGTYVFSISGTDAANGAPYAMVGTFTANGAGGNNKGGITGGTLDINDVVSGQAADASINSNSYYTVSIDGRGQATLGTNIGNGFPNITLDFVLSSSSHGLVIEFDTFGTGSGTLDLQAAGVTPAGSYAFSFSGNNSGGSPWATAGNFTLSGTTASGLEDFNEAGIITYPAQSLGGSVVVSSTAPLTTLDFPNIGSLTFDVFPIDATHLKFIEMDTTATLSGDAFSQTSPTISAGTMAFTLAGFEFASGGFMVTDSAGNITSSSSEDVNEAGSVVSVPSFTGSYAASGTGRYTLGSFQNFAGGTSYAAYPSSGGLLLLEIDTAGITTGAAYPQSPTATFAVPQGYGLNLSGYNIGNTTEVDDIAEFTTNSSGSTITGLIDENTALDGTVAFAAPFVSGTFTAPVNGRGSISTAVGNNSTNTTLNGGFTLTFYTADGTTFPFIQTDSNGQVATGVFVAQSSSASAAAAQSHMFIPQPLIRAHSARQKQKKTN